MAGAKLALQCRKEEVADSFGHEDLVLPANGHGAPDLLDLQVTDDQHTRGQPVTKVSVLLGSGCRCNSVDEPKQIGGARCTRIAASARSRSRSSSSAPGS
jgi:hypothetical protein